MNCAKRLVPTTAAILLLVSIVSAQDQNSATGSRSMATVTAAVTADRVRFTAPLTVVQMRLEVYAANGEKLFDNEIRGGNVIDWHLQDGQAERISDGSYLCVITSKGLSGRMSQKLGRITIENAAASVQPMDMTQLTAQQSQAVGPLEENAFLTVLKEGETQTATVIAHNGIEGQLIRGRGALSFRIGDFFSGKDTEQMRLSEEGNLGIGTSEPRVKLDVAGMISARQGLMFSDGSTLNVNRKGVLAHKSAKGDVSASATGIGTMNRLARWTDSSGTLGDSIFGEAGGGVELRPASAGVGINPIFINPSTVVGFSQLQAYPAVGENTNSSLAVVPRGTGATNNRAQLTVLNTDYIADSTNYEFASLRARGSDFVFGTGRSGTGVNRPFMFAAGFLSDNTTNDGQLYLAANGKVGIGTASPGSKLTVSGVIESTSGGIKFPDGTVQTTAVAASTGGGVPAGTIVAYAGPIGSVPAGWLVCDGAAVSRTQNALLFGSIGISWGSGDGSTTFNLPDLSGRFLRGVDKDGNGTPSATPRDPDREARIAASPGGNTGNNVGSLQIDEFTSHTHNAAANTSFVLTHVPQNGLNTIHVLSGASVDLDISQTTAPRGGSETRPKNAYVMWIIKAN
jgi:microcystin-dependent protein